MSKSIERSAWSALLLLTLACSRNEPATNRAAAEPDVTPAAPVAAATPPSSPAVGVQQSTTGEQAAGQSEAVAEAPGAAAADGGSASGASASTGASDAKPMREPDVVFVPTPQPIVDKMLELAKLKKGDVLYDLGSGDGRIVVTAAKKYGVRAYGFDIDPRRVEEARQNIRKNGVEDLASIEQKDIFTLDLSPASVVTLYLLPQLNVKLIPQLQQLKPGSRVVSHDFDMKGVEPLKHLSLKPAGVDREHDVYLWHAPIKKTPGAG